MYKVLFIDAVTTGMNPYRCCLHRLSGIFTVNGKEVKRFEIRMRAYESSDIYENSLAMCNETRSSINRYPDQGKAFADFLALLDEQVDLHNPKDKVFLGGFNTDRFEYIFLREWFKRNGNERFRDYFHVQTFDMMCLANFAILGHRSALPDFYLETAAREIGLRTSWDKNYDGLNCAKMSLDMFRVLAQRWGIDELRDFEESQDIFRNF